ncbi:hypothetical protein BKP37_07675 [Anaerobacillus alkalilacustris]|uniref:Uncharacterized protein n=1 Tax=Anaerobacillus alkalilacustris TaxID=393763 RepID=A0A1S2LR27_9BACI|nr:hypothetical protein [Anaerobacillus alkalilacustris]OIJ14846.1 hypothetical protein BKP37_07675 [Anaerobacillus alkalilacustris]
MKKRIAFLVIGYLCLKQSNNLFPKIEGLSSDFIINKLVFNPFQWLGSVLLFIIGFLFIARVIKSVAETIIKKSTTYQQLGWISVIILVFLLIGFESLWLAIGSGIVSLFYGLMDANVTKRNRYYQS